ncbi:glutamate-5-semialdehyde dehydrogenase [Streptomyces sp. NPDC101160]|uniref:glutamate-5-semialdehyde dehydrogenase n=1 Tax=Streptomyces sp. NPDC101160 TaxID=3366118 RepID=UPI0037F4A890
MLDEMLSAAKAARLAAPPPGEANYLSYCKELATSLRTHWDAVLAANAEDIAAARARGLSETLIDRLTMGTPQLDYLVGLTERVAAELPEVTSASEAHTASGAMAVRRIPKPLGLILMIYEARPTVTVEGALLPVAAGNCALLRGGSEIAHTAGALRTVVADALAAAGLPADMVQIITDPDRKLVRELLKRPDAIDALLPRGSAALVDYCQSTSTIPVIASGGGVNHLYVDSSADVDLAARVVLDSKLAEPTACNTLEMVLAHSDVAGDLVRRLVDLGGESSHAYALRLGPGLADQAPADGGEGAVTVEALSDTDNGREFLDRTLGVRAVDGLDEAVAHIRRYGSRHTEGVVAADGEVVDRFLRTVDAAALVVNGSLRLHDGPTMRLGPELSISTARLHVRGPVNLAALMTYSWVVEGNGTLRGAGEEEA